MKCVHGNDMGQSCKHCVGATPGYREIDPSALNSMSHATYAKDQAKPITASDCYSTTPVELCPCARCTVFRENNHRNLYVGMTHNDLMHLVKYGGEKAAGRAPSGVIKDLAHGAFVEVPNHRDHLNERLCNELANLSRNVAGLTGVAKQLAEAQTARERANAQPSPIESDWYWYSDACVVFINQIQDRMGNGHQEFLTSAVQQFLKQLGLKVNKRPYD